MKLFYSILNMQQKDLKEQRLKHMHNPIVQVNPKPSADCVPNGLS